MIHFRDMGQGLPVLLLHAFPLNGDSFRPQLDALSGKYRFIVPDLPGFGQSPALGPSGSPLDMDKIAEDALEILDALAIDSAVVGGVSMGGYASIALLRLDPSRVRALVLADTQHTVDDESGRKKREETAQMIEREGVESLVSAMMPKLLAQETPETVRLEVARQIRTASVAGAAAASRGMALRSDGRDILPRFNGPALVLVGEHDTPTPPAKAEALAQLIPDAKAVVIPGAGHLANQEAPERFNRELDAFLKTLSQ